MQMEEDREGRALARGDGTDLRDRIGDEPDQDRDDEQPRHEHIDPAIDKGGEIAASALDHDVVRYRSHRVSSLEYLHELAGLRRRGNCSAPKIRRTRFALSRRIA